MWTPEVVKGLVLGALFVLTFAFSMLPLKFVSLAHSVTADPEKRLRFQRVVSFLSCFAAGVFLGTCFLDLFPEVKDKMTEVYFRFEIYSTFPMAEFLMIFGFFLILIIEQITLSIKERDVLGKEHQGGVSKPLLSRQKDECKYRTINTDDEMSRSGSFRDQLESQVSIEGIRDQPNFSPISSREHIIQPDEDGHEDVYSHSVHADLSSHSVVRSLILVVALSLHSIFEGLAVGLQPSSEQVIQIFSALVLHKCILSFSLGLNLMQSKLSKWATIRANFLFSITSPIGIGIGIAVVDFSGSVYSSLVNGLLQGIACGTFLYVTFFEVLPHEFNSNDYRLIKLLCLILGYAAIVGIEFINPDTTRPPCYRQPKP